MMGLTKSLLIVHVYFFLLGTRLATQKLRDFQARVMRQGPKMWHKYIRITFHKSFTNVHHEIFKKNILTLILTADQTAIQIGQLLRRTQNITRDEISRYDEFRTKLAEIMMVRRFS